MCGKFKGTSITLDNKLVDQIEKYLDENALSMSTFLRIAAREFLRNYMEGKE